MSWNYRIVQYASDGTFGLHEVHYDEQGRPKSMTLHPCGFVGDTPEELRDALMLAKMDATRRPILQESELGIRRGATDTREGTE